MNAHDQARAMVYADVCRRRREIASRSPAMFARTYLGHHFTLPPSPMHEALFGALKGASDARGQRLAIAAPRGHAKSTCVSLAYALYATLCRDERYVLIVSATKEQAGQLLKHVKDEIETNAMLQDDFPEACPGERKPTPWRGTRISLHNGAFLHAVGSGQQIRGTKTGPHRPSLIIVDDLEDQEHVHSGDQRIKTQEWFEKTLLKVGDTGTNVVVVGTVLHYDALLARLMDPLKSPGWKRWKYRALLSEPTRTDLWQEWESIYCGREHWEGAEGADAAHAFYTAHRSEMDEGAEVLWPEKEPIGTLMEIRLREGRLSFDSEKQNEPIDSEHCLFRLESMIYWDDEHGTEDNLLRYLGDGVSIYGAWDPSLGTDPRRGDYSAIVIVARHRKTETHYVLAADIARRQPAQAIARIVEYAQMYRFKSFVVEENGFQREVMANLKKAASDAGVPLRVRGVKNTGNKRGRIELLEPQVTQGKLRFCRKHTVLLEQLRQFPLAAHDDGPDALHMAVTAKAMPKPEIIILDGDSDRLPGSTVYHLPI